jgi:hypothetical protein
VLRSLLQSRSSRQDVGMVVIEDLHWIDEGSDAWVAEWAEATAGAPNLLLVNFRPEYRAPWMQRPHYQQIALAPLSPEAIRELLSKRIGDDPSTGGLAGRIHAHTAGNPFFAEEMVQALIESGQLEGAPGAYRLVGTVERIEVPASVHALLAARIDRLAEREKRVLQVASVIGKEFSEPLLADVSALPERDLSDALAALRAAEFLQQLSLYPVAEYTFKHPLTQEVAQDSLLRGRRREIHAAPMRADDGLIVFNFRADRARQITRALALGDDQFDGFARPGRPTLHPTTMTVYDRTFNLPVVFTPQTFSNNLADVLAAHGRTNLRLAETEKYAHVTYFFNCGREEPYAGEDRILVPSQKVATYDLMPEMSAPGIADNLVADLTSLRHQAVICNFANADMVGHTGRIDATVRAVETLDGCLGRIMTALRSVGGTAIVTSDHGNAEQMWDDELKAPHTAHTSNPVPVVLCSDVFVGRRLKDGWLRDVAPTILDLLDIPLAPEMTGRSLIEK